MNKRGQIYILVALVMSIAIFGLVSVSNNVVQENVKSNFEKLSSNYASESTKLVNELINNPKKEVGEEFRAFTQLFTAYSKIQSPEFGLVYIFEYDGLLYLGNYMDEGFIVSGECEGSDCSLDGCYEKIPASVGFEGSGFNIDIPQVEFTECVAELDSGDFKSKIIPDTLEILIGDEMVPYTFTLKEGQPEIIMVSWENQGNQRKVFTEGDLTPQ